jgi:hypothetical protein
VPGARAFGCYPEDYDALEPALVPADDLRAVASALRLAAFG